MIDWLNEIYCWGLTVHATHCERDIKISMKINSVGSGFIVSEIASDSEYDNAGMPETKQSQIYRYVVPLVWRLAVPVINTFQRSLFLRIECRQIPVQTLVSRLQFPSSIPNMLTNAKAHFCSGGPRCCFDQPVDLIGGRHASCHVFCKVETELNRRGRVHILLRQC